MLNYKYITNNKSLNSSTLVFIAGFTGTLETWNLCCDDLQQFGNYNILLIDNLGAGKSPQPHGKYSSKVMALEIIKIIKYLNINSIVLIGHSLGGAIAQQICLIENNLVKSLILISSFAKINNICRYFLLGRYELLKNNVPKDVIALNTLPSIFSSSYLSVKKNVTFAIERIVNNPQLLEGMHGQLYACLDHDITKETSKIVTPTTIVTGDKDLLVEPSHSQFLLKNIKGSKLITIPEVAHMVQLEAYKLLSEIIHKNYACS